MWCVLLQSAESERRGLKYAPCSWNEPQVHSTGRWTVRMTCVELFFLGYCWSFLQHFLYLRAYYYAVQRAPGYQGALESCVQLLGSLRSPLRMFFYLHGDSNVGFFSISAWHYVILLRILQHSLDDELCTVCSYFVPTILQAAASVQDFIFWRLLIKERYPCRLLYLRVIQTRI